MDPAEVADYACHTGECPVWHDDQQALYWIDIPTGRLFRYVPAADRHEQCAEGEALRAITVEADGALLLFYEAGDVVRWDDGAVDPVSVDLPYTDGFRFNDVAADPRGRVFCGVFPTEDRAGSLFRLGRDGSMVRVLDDVAFPNGMAVGPDHETFYFTDTRANAIYAFDYDLESGALSNRRVFADTAADEGFPDGLAVDAEGHVWSSRWDGGRIVRYDPGGSRVTDVTFPARKVTSLAFGGDGYADAYVTTALASSGDPIGTTAEEGAGAGTLLRADLGVAGRPPYRSSIAT